MLQALEAGWGDAAMLLSAPYQGLGNAAISGMATDEQRNRRAGYGRRWLSAGVEISYDKPSHAQSAAAAEFCGWRPIGRPAIC
jgi:acyl-CoA dehydrogenase